MTMTERETLKGNELWVVYNGCSWPVCTIDDISEMIDYAKSLGCNANTLHDLIDITKNGIKELFKEHGTDDPKDLANKVYFEQRPLFTSAQFQIMSPNGGTLGSIKDLEELLTLNMCSPASIFYAPFFKISLDNKECSKVGLYYLFKNTEVFVYYGQ